MICVECDEPVSSLYTEYANGHIKLTDCPKCSKTTDKYVEFDSVILFIDVLLMKPQAYKHLVFNLMSDDYHTTHDNTQQQPRGNIISRWLRRNKVQRIRFFAVLFEIYLTWAHEEKNYNRLTTSHSTFLISHAILRRPVVIQYLLFAVKCICDDLIAHWIVQWLIFHWIGWRPKTLNAKDTTQYFKDALSLTVVISGGTKLFPILMLIWPYDDVTITNVINSVANVNLIESLRVVTGIPLVQSIAVFSVTAIAKLLVTKALLAVMLSGGDVAMWGLFMQNEYRNGLTGLTAAFEPFLSHDV